MASVGEHPAASQEILLLNEIVEEAPAPIAMPKPRPMSSPRPGVPHRIGPYYVTKSFPSGMVDGVFLGYKVSQHGLVTHAVLKWARSSRPDYDARREVLLDEARALSFVHHPNVVRVLDSGEDDSGLHVAIEYVPGCDLRTITQSLRKVDRRLPVSLSCFVAVNVLRGLDHAHRAKDGSGEPLELVHRDVTPSNILVSYEGHIKLTDFGVVRMRNRQQAETMPGMVKGKFRYMAPEYVEGGPPSPRSDLYAVGITLFELLTGRTAFAQEGRRNIFKAIVQEGLELEALHAAGLPDALVHIVTTATQRAPDKRYFSSGDMANAIETWLARDGAYVSATAMASVLKRLGLGPEDPPAGQ